MQCTYVYYYHGHNKKRVNFLNYWKIDNTICIISYNNYFKGTAEKINHVETTNLCVL